MAELSRCKPLLGTYVEIYIQAEASQSDILAASEAGFAVIEKIHKLMSFHEVESELSRINRDASQKPVEISVETYDVIKFALELSHLTQGLYDISIAPCLVKSGLLPAHQNDGGKGDWTNIHLSQQDIKFDKNILIDLGGIAKGYAVDRAFDIITARGLNFSQISINAGGDMRLLEWKNKPVSIRYPGILGLYHISESRMQNTALATSAPQSWSAPKHIINPRKNKIRGVKKSISVFAPKCIIADALTKVFYLTSDYTHILKSFNAKVLIINQYGKKLGLS